MKEFRGQISAAPQDKYALVAAHFHKRITEQLVAGAAREFARRRVPDANVHCIWVPGAFEIPAVCKQLMRRGDYAAVVALGAVIRGETSHYDYVCDAVTRGVAQLNLDGAELRPPVPVIFGVLTTDNAQQAEARAAMSGGDKGGAAAAAALEMVDLLRQL